MNRRFLSSGGGNWRVVLVLVLVLCATVIRWTAIFMFIFFRCTQSVVVI